MKDIRTTIEVNAHILNFSDKVVMISLMDALTVSIKENNTLTISNIELPREMTEKMMQVLSNIGCRNSLGESYSDIMNK